MGLRAADNLRCRDRTASDKEVYSQKRRELLRLRPLRLHPPVLQQDPACKWPEDGAVGHSGRPSDAREIPNGDLEVTEASGALRDAGSKEGGGGSLTVLPPAHFKNDRDNTHNVVV